MRNKYKLYYDKTHRTVNFEEGSQIMLFTPHTKVGFSTKFLSRWDGPFTVLNKLSNLNYRVENLDKSRTMVVHVQRMRKYRPWNRDS